VRSALLIFLLAAGAASLEAQSIERASMDAAVAVTQSFGPDAGDRPDIIIDFTGTLRLGGGWVAYARPWFRRASTAPYSFAKTLYQGAVQHEHRGARLSTRLDLGYILSPIGIGMMDMRPDTNPVTSPHLSYLVPMPAFDPGAPGSMPIASSYPLGAVLTASTTHWDGRAGLMAAPPNRMYVLGASAPNPKARPFAVVGGGFTPWTGLRVGAAYARGAYATAEEMPRTPNGRQLNMASVEGDFAFGYTKITGEITRDSIETATNRAQATQWFIQGSQTLTPRWVLGLRHEGGNAPPSFLGPKPTLRLSEVAASYRLTPDVTIRNGLSARKTYFEQGLDPQFAVMLIWARRY
jgi:hypothetical protein